MVTAGLALAAFFLGSGVGLGLVYWIRRSHLVRVGADEAVRLRETEREVEQLAAAAQQRIDEAAAELEREADDELEAAQRELDDHAAELEERERVLRMRENDIGELKKEVRGREAAVQEEKQEIKRLLKERETVAVGVQRKLEELSGMAPEDAIERQVNDWLEKSSHQGQIWIRDHEEHTRENSANDAARLMATVVDRYNGISHLERVHNAIPIPDNRTRAAFVAPDSPACAAFAEVVGCELLCDEAAGTAIVRGDDPLAREVARRTLRQIANRSIFSPDRVRGLARQVKGDVDREVQNAGRRAVRSLGLRKVHPEILHLVGRLKFRLSYSQNQLKHAIEVAYLSGMLADELHVDVAIARRGGLLHDIGKALTHEREGSHAVLGAEVARRCGEDEAVANAIGAHHNDEPPQGPIAHIVTAADALSGARPGARRESVTSYISRMQEIQEIASRSPVVKRVDVMHAGREVRIIVAGEERGAIDEQEKSHGPVLTDAELHPLAQDIARDLEEEIPFAGQIRVTVIRESRAVSIAS
jgi:ribonuclease Y